jgi:hypothetical protein
VDFPTQSLKLDRYKLDFVDQFHKGKWQFVETVRYSGADKKSREASSRDIPTSKAFAAHLYATPLKGIPYFCPSSSH